MIIELIIGGIFGFMLATVIQENNEPKAQTIYYYVEKDTHRTSVLKFKNNE